ncbi:alpha/beta-Hydrolases superfamily protein [Striga asiatica]|uniref:Alpha/beta-Hydrolases superfamily protein n=1 Tax=Striga asiatica TaxID=4170 RepID=A0A5A7QWC8_STRAF|nr:alpha/beta-Hydrolases superfamily protein [Striga asiatica]
MAPGLVRNPKPRIIPNNSRQILMEHITGGLTRNKTRQSEKTEMASDKVNKGLPITDGSSIGSKTANPTFEGNMPTNQPPQTHQKENTLMPEVQTPQTQTQHKESTLLQEVQTQQQEERTRQNQSQQNGSTLHSPLQEGSQHTQSPQADIIGVGGQVGR